MTNIEKIRFNEVDYGIGNVDTTLTESGVAADAKTVGDLLSNITLGINPNDNLLYIYLDGSPVGDGVDISGGSVGTRYSIAWNLQNCTAYPKMVSILENRQLLTTITPNTNYTIADVIVSMGNTDITSSSYSNGIININSVTGDVNISVTAKDYIPGRLLVWEDDFDGTEVDPTKWRYRLYGNGATWHGLTDEATTVSDSILDIKVSYDFENGWWNNTMMTTNGLEEIKYGRLEARMKCNLNTENAFWTVGQTFTQYNQVSEGLIWPYSGEVDIIEILARQFATSALAWKSNISGADTLLVASTSNIDIEDWHIYSMEWTSTDMSFYIDDILTGSVDITNKVYSDGFNPFNAPHYMLLDSFGSNNSDTSKEYHTYVDWVRVYAPIGVSQKSNITALALSEQTTSLNKNKTKYLSLSVTPSSPTDYTLIWESSDREVATFAGGNTIVTKSNGTATLTVRSKNGVSASTALTVSDSVVNLVQNISLSFPVVSKYIAGEEIQLTADVTPIWATDSSVTWSSSDSNVATVSNDGLVSFVSVGNVTITASANDTSGETATQSFNVSAAYQDLIDTTGCVSKLTRNGMANGLWTNDIANAGDSTGNQITYINGLGMQGRYATLVALTPVDLVDINGPFTMVSRLLYAKDLSHTQSDEMTLTDSNNTLTSQIRVFNGSVYAYNGSGTIVYNGGNNVTGGQINNNAEDVTRTVVLTKGSDKTIKIYTNGVLSDTTTAFVNLADMSATGIVFGTRKQPTNAYLQALLLYNRELNATEVSNLQSALDTMWS